MRPPRLILGVATVVACLVPSTAFAFTDVPSGSWFHPYVTYLASHDIISSSSPLFRPTDALTRAELAKIVVTARRFPLVAPVGTRFCDVPASSWAAQYIEALALRSIVKGTQTPCGTSFEPDRSVTRAEALKILEVSFGLTPAAPSVAPTADVPADAWFAPFVVEAISRNVIQNPGPTGLFRPMLPVSRSEAAKMLVLLMDPSDFPTPSGT